jgi:Zn-finger nucleic acid-binding protein
VKLVSCPQCHAQYDLALRPESGGSFDCRCGATLEAVAPKGAADAPAERCSACGALAKAGDEVCAFCGSGIVPSVDPGSLICPECFARNADESRFCAGCGVAFEPQPWPAADGDDAAKCPCCARAMHAREVGGLVVHECGKCNGLWVPLDRFSALVDRAAETARARVEGGSLSAPRVDGDNPASRQVEYRRCPVCDALMARRNYQKRSGVIIDQCHEHGTWLDANELERIAGYVLSGRAQRVADAEAESAEQREKAAADEAVRRVRTEAFREQGLRGLFGADVKPSGRSTLLEFLSTLLD